MVTCEIRNKSRIPQFQKKMPFYSICQILSLARTKERVESKTFKNSTWVATSRKGLISPFHHSNVFVRAQLNQRRSITISSQRERAEPVKLLQKKIKWKRRRRVRIVAKKIGSPDMPTCPGVCDNVFHFHILYIEKAKLFSLLTKLL